MRNRAQDCLGSSLQQIREPYQEAAIAQPDRVVDVGKRKEFDFQLGQGRGWTQLATGFLENFKQAFTHSESRLAR